MKHLLIALSLAAALPSAAYAAKDGLLGATSTGEVDVYMTIKTTELVKISGLESLTFTIEDGNDPTIPFREMFFCVYSSLGGDFTIEMTAGNLRRQQTDLPYNFALSEVDATGQRTRSLFTGSVANAPVVQTAVDVTPATTEDCDGTHENMRFAVQLRPETIGAGLTRPATTQIDFTVMAQ